MNLAQREEAAERQRRGLPVVGLSTVHISPVRPGPSSHGPGDWEEYRDGDGLQRTPVLEFADGGEFAHVSIPRPASMPAPGGRRGSVKEFSHASRRRLQKTLASIDRSQMPRLPLFLTLTYPAKWTDDAALWKSHLDAFFKRLTRKLPDAAAVWKLEFQKRGAPHYHLLLFNCVYLSAKWVAEAWNEIIAPGDTDHLRAGTEVRRVKTWRGVASYAAKYMSKSEDLREHGKVGRYWGIHNRRALPINLVRAALSWLQAYTIRRTFYRMLDKIGRGPRRKGSLHGQSMFIASKELLRIIDNLTGAQPAPPAREGAFTW